MLILYSLSIFCGAALLFLVQPMFARFVLPSLGGSPAVWNTALVFYQTVLLAGYAWTHFTVQKLGARHQAWLHCAVLALALFFLPIALPTSWTPPTQGSPSLWLLGAMLLTVGPPFFAVSTTSPALQRWFATTNHPAARDPYFLYAASNAGSLLALVAYPFILEPRLRLIEQSRLWAFGFGALLVLCLACAWALSKSTPQEVLEVDPDEVQSNSTVLREEPITLARRLRWIALAAVPSSLMVGVTTYLSNEIAAIPLLWIVPLVLYLLSFIIVFSRRGEAATGIAARAFALLVLPLLVTLASRAAGPMNLLMPLNLVVLFAAATMCHGELARDRPAASRLTEFYLLMSLGGALGGAFNALFAPVAFKSVIEYPLALAAACALVPATLIGAKEKPAFKLQDLFYALGLGALTAALVYFLQRRGIDDGPVALAMMFGPAVLACFAWSRKPARFALAVLGVVFAGTLFHGRQESRVLRVERSFFGIHRVTISTNKRFRQLIHGNTLHGSQALDPNRANEPLAYYYRTGPIGQVFEAMEPQLKNVGVVGLGVGSLAPYGRANQNWTYYEIDPEVEAIARENFTFLKNCRADLKVILGDARLSLKTAPQGGYDLLALDAYSSDAIPVHLMTREAMQLYLRSLAPRGVLAFHISNRHLDLEPVLGTLARDAGLVSRVCNDTKIPNTESRLGKSGSQWMILARRAADFGALGRDVRWTTPRVSSSPVWTDDYSSLLPALTWR